MARGRCESVRGPSVRDIGWLARVAPLYDLATGLAYEQDNVDRSVALSIGGERHVNRIRLKQWEKAAVVLGLSPDVLVDRVAYLADRFPDAFRDALAEVAGVPGAGGCCSDVRRDREALPGGAGGLVTGRTKESRSRAPSCRLRDGPWMTALA